MTNPEIQLVVRIENVGFDHKVLWLPSLFSGIFFAILGFHLLSSGARSEEEFITIIGVTILGLSCAILSFLSLIPRQPAKKIKLR